MSSSSSSLLTQGAVQYMVENFRMGQRPNHTYTPVVQMIDVRQVNSNDRFRVVISDGTHYVNGMLATQLNRLVHEKQLLTDMIVTLEEFMVNTVADKPVIIVLRLRIHNNNNHQQHSLGPIGSPVLYTVTPPTTTTTTASHTPAAPLYNSTNGTTMMNHNHNTTTTATTATTAAVGGGPAKQPPTTTTAASAHNHNNNNTISSSSSHSRYPTTHNPYGSPPPKNNNNNNNNSNNNAPPIVRSDPQPQPHHHHHHSPFTSIAELNLYNNRWMIRARVTSKSDIKTWSNAKGEGTLFSMELLDASGTDIRASCFREAVDKFYPLLNVGKIYRMSGGKLKVANMQWNTCKSNYEITFDMNAEIHLEDDDDESNNDNNNNNNNNSHQAIQAQLYNLVPLAELEHMPDKTFVDVIAIVKNVSDPVTLLSKKSGQELTKCDASLVDDSGVEVTITQWGDKAKRLSAELTTAPPPVVVAFRRARVSDYGGKTLSAGDGMDVNPNLPQAAALRNWWRTQGGANSAVHARKLSTMGGGGGGNGKVDSVTERKPISCIKDENLGHNASSGPGQQGAADYVSFKATLTYIKSDKEGGAWYTACPDAGEPCKNRYKVTQTTTGEYHCEKCQTTFPNCTRRYIFNGVIEDESGTTWVAFFNEQAEQLLGVTADDAFHRAYYANNGAGGPDMNVYKSYFARAKDTEWIFKCRVKNEMVNDEMRTKTSVVNMFPVDYVKESRDLLTEIAKF